MDVLILYEPFMVAIYHHQGDCSLSETGLDEAQQRGPELGDLHGELQGLDEEGLESGMATPPHYMSQSKSLPRLSRMDSHRVGEGPLYHFIAFYLYNMYIDTYGLCYKQITRYPCP